MQACTLDGTTYDISNIVPYVIKHKKHPVTGEALALKDIVKLNFAKSAEGEYICPMLKKAFTDHTHIVAIRTSGNVYCWEVSTTVGIAGMLGVIDVAQKHLLAQVTSSDLCNPFEGTLMMLHCAECTIITACALEGCTMACNYLAETSLDAHNVTVPCDMPYSFRLITMALGRLQDILSYLTHQR